MSYRGHSFGPSIHEKPGRPLRPFNWVQWTGVGLEVVGLGLVLAHFAGRIGWIAPAEEVQFGFVPMILGALLINSRREPGTLITSEQLARNRQMLLIIVAVCAAVLGAALITEYWRA
jgi:hypothetical protein